MPDEVGAEAKAAAALWAGVRPLARVGTGMLRQVGAVTETPAAHLAAVRLLPGVHPSVFGQG